MTDILHKYMTKEEINQKIREYLENKDVQWKPFGVTERQLWLNKPEAHVKLYLDRKSNFSRFWMHADLIVHFWGHGKNKWDGNFYKEYFMDNETREMAVSVYERVHEMAINNLMHEIRQQQCKIK